METKEIESAVEAKICERGISFTAEFVPQSKSRNRDEENPTLNWRVTFARNGKAFTTDYQQGSGHIPAEWNKGWAKYPSSDQAMAIRDACESGKYARELGYIGNRLPVPPPIATAVLACLLSDADALDYPTYEEWAPELGYDLDSRKGERVYRACLESALAMRALFGEALMGELREIVADY